MEVEPDEFLGTIAFLSVTATSLILNGVFIAILFAFVCKRIQEPSTSAKDSRVNQGYAYCVSCLKETTGRYCCQNCAERLRSARKTD